MTDIVLRINELLTSVTTSARELAGALFDAQREIERLRTEIRHYEHQCELGSLEIERLHSIIRTTVASLEAMGTDEVNCLQDELKTEIAKW